MELLHLFVLIGLFGLTRSHSWMTCPPSFSGSDTGRGGHQSSLCENNGASAYVTNVEAGDRLKVGWTSNNHAGGYVRISLVPYNMNGYSENTAKENVMKFVCYGHDSRYPTLAQRGDCTHPCNARGGCQYQSHVEDKERYDTTIGIPTNLEMGLYTLQTTLFVGNTGTPYYSCAKVYISGGDTSFNCKSNEEPITYTCIKSRSGINLTISDKKIGAKRGDFCYHLDGKRGTVDDQIRNVPINVECDPRMSCSASVESDVCISEVPGMSGILLRDSQHRVQPSCYIYNTLPPLSPTCDDGIQNGDEEGVDCGGKSCQHIPCPTPLPSSSEYYDYIIQEGIPWASGVVVNMYADIKKDLPIGSCWRLTLQFGCPVEIKGNPWSSASLVPREKYPANFLKFEQDPLSTRRIQRPPTNSASKVILASFELNNPCTTSTSEICDGCSAWNTELIHFNAGLFKVFDNANDCYFKPATN